MDDDSPQDDDTLDIAASMGFTSFGSKPPKKRKFNPRTDAAVDSSTGEVVAGSGGNSILLGKARGGRESGESKGYGGGSEGCGAEQGEGEGEGEGDGGDPGYVDDTPEGSPGIIGGDGEGGLEKEVEEEETRGLKKNPGQTHSSSTGDTTSTHLQHPSLPLKPAFVVPPSTAAEFEGGRSIPSEAGHITREEAQRLRRGVRDRNGDIAYYDASFVEDPWEGLEVARRGLRG
ncbi:MAG: hypothetical protein M1836_005915 [Candelina mexicana]|nr:MAG: hypothetical protein M1836_005915 [Candelina mexicana]